MKQLCLIKQFFALCALCEMHQLVPRGGRSNDKQLYLTLQGPRLGKKKYPIDRDQKKI